MYQCFEHVSCPGHKPVWKAKLNKTCFTWPISMVGSPASPHFVYVRTSSVKGSLVKAGWYGVFLCLGSHWGKRSSWKQERVSVMLLETPGTWWALDKEIVFHRKEYKEPREVHYTRGLWMTRVNNGDHQFIIAPKLNSLARKMWEPECARHTIRKSSCHSMLIPLVGLKRMWGSYFPWNYRLIK